MELFKERQINIWKDTKQFLNTLESRARIDRFFNFRISDLNEIEKYDLRRKLISYFSNARIPKTEQNLSSLIDSILSLGLVVTRTLEI